MRVKIYTDGGCSGNPGPGGWAYVIIGDGGENTGALPGDKAGSPDVLVEKWGAERNSTNNRMELYAVIAALEELSRFNPPPDSVTVYTDSQYVQKGMSSWIQNWKMKGWRTSGKEPVKNQELWQRLDKLAGNFAVTWKWVKGHAGNRYNERCDRMTQTAIASLGER
ncbi:MAG: ribonuclease HI [Spirochaetaceae bacterium]|nr:ribonuclease HI [Spirochaetaceae bacterium]